MALRAAVANGNWSLASTWNGGILPAPGDVVASNNFTVTIDQNINVDRLTNAATAPFIISAAMTSNTAPSGIVTASGVFGGGFEAWRAFDQVTFNNWLSNLPTGWVAYEFTTPKLVQLYQMFPPGNNAPNSVPRNWTFEAWDGSAWIVLDTVTGNSGTATVTRSLTNTTAYIKYRINITANNGDGSYTGVTELRMYEANDYAQNTVAGGGFTVNGNFTITTTTLVRASNLITYTGSGTLNIATNIPNASGSGQYLTINGNGNVNWVGSIYSNYATLSISKNGTGKLTITGDLSGAASNSSIVQVNGGDIEVIGTLTISNVSTSISGAINCVIYLAGTIGQCVVTGNMVNNNTTTNFNGPQQNSPNCIYTSNPYYIKHIGTMQNLGLFIGFCVTSTSASAINIFSGPFICNSNGATPFYVTRMHYQRTLGSYYEFRDNSTNGALPPAAAAPTIRLNSPEVGSDLPAVANVRFGTTYGYGSLTGTLRMPTANQVTYGVAVDNTFGAAVLTAASVWDYLVANITVENSIGMRLKNVSTPQITGEQLEAFLRLD